MSRRPIVRPEAEELIEAFFHLLNLRSQDWITIVDIRTYMELFPVPYREWFPRLMMDAQHVYSEAKLEAAEKRDKASDKLKQHFK